MWRKERICLSLALATPTQSHLLEGTLDVICVGACFFQLLRVDIYFGQIIFEGGNDAILSKILLGQTR